jgi:hypothetical protein
MEQWEYEALQDALTKKSENNPYGRTGNFKREDGYKEGILAAKSILHEFYQRKVDKMPLKITRCTGNGQGECTRCKQLKGWSREWMTFLYKIEGRDGLYCGDCVRQIAKEMQ